MVHVGDDLPVLVVDDGGEFVQQPDAEAELVRADRNQIRVSEVPDQNVEKLSGLKNWPVNIVEAWSNEKKPSRFMQQKNVP